MAMRATAWSLTVLGVLAVLGLASWVVWADCPTCPSDDEWEPYSAPQIKSPTEDYCLKSKTSGAYEDTHEWTICVGTEMSFTITGTDTDWCDCLAGDPPSHTAEDSPFRYRWKLDGDVQAETSNIYTHTFDTPGDYTVSVDGNGVTDVKCDPRGADNWVSPLDTAVTVHVVEVDLAVQGATEAQEEDPGGYVPLNNDDDNDNDTADNSEDPVTGEDDLISLTLDADGGRVEDCGLDLRDQG